MIHNNDLNSQNADNQITQRLLENAQKLQYNLQASHDFSGLEEQEQEENKDYYINPLLLMPSTAQDKKITLWGISTREYKKPNPKGLVVVEIHELSFLERPLGNAFAEVLAKYPKGIVFSEKAIEILEPNIGGILFDERPAGVVVIPLSLKRIFEYKVPRNYYQMKILQ
jgi:hypothetical protein